MALGSIHSLTEMIPGILPDNKGGRCVGLTLPLSCADCLKIWEPQSPETLRARSGLRVVQGLIYLYTKTLDRE